MFSPQLGYTSGSLSSSRRREHALDRVAPPTLIIGSLESQQLWAEPSRAGLSRLLSAPSAPFLLSLELQFTPVVLCVMHSSVCFKSLPEERRTQRAKPTTEAQVSVHGDGVTEQACTGLEGSDTAVMRSPGGSRPSLYQPVAGQDRWGSPSVTFQRHKLGTEAGLVRASP